MTREEALQIIWDRCQHSKETEKALEVLKEERPHGTWEACLDTEYCKCSYCGTVVMLEESVIFHFCPNCGADMRDKKDDLAEIIEAVQSIKEGGAE